MPGDRPPVAVLEPEQDVAHPAGERRGHEHAAARPAAAGPTSGEPAGPAQRRPWCVAAGAAGHEDHGAIMDEGCASVARWPIRLPEPSLVVLVGTAGSGQVDVGGVVVRPGGRRVVRRPAGGRRPPPPRPAGDQRRPRGARADHRQAPRPRAADGRRLDRPRRRASRARYRALAAAAGVPCHAVVVDTPERETRARNRGRPEAVPSAVVTSQLRAARRDRRGARRRVRRRPPRLRRAGRDRAPVRSTTHRPPPGARRRHP